MFLQIQSLYLGSGSPIHIFCIGPNLAFYSHHEFMLLSHLARAVPGHLFCALLVRVVPAVLALDALLDDTHQHLAAEVALGRLRVPNQFNNYNIIN